MDFFSFYRPFENENFISQCNVPWLKMACQWKDEYVIYRLGGPYGINLRQRAAFSSPKSEFSPYGSSLSQLIAYRCNLFFFLVREWGVFYNFVIWLVLGILAILSHPHPPPLFYENGEKKSLSVLSKKQKKE